MGLVIQVCFLLGLLTSAAVNAAGPEQEAVLFPVTTNNKIPPIDLSDIQGRPIQLLLAPGRVNIVHFWATWCTPCLKELPTLFNLAQDREFSNINIMLIAADSHQAVKQFLESQPLPGIALIDQYGKAMHAYNIRALPASFITDRSAQIIYKANGKLDWNNPTIKNLLKSLLIPPK